MAKNKPLFQIDGSLRKGERTRLMVYESAFRCIARDGYYRTTFQTIADQAGLSQPLVVKIFRTKENIFPAVTRALLEIATELTREHLDAIEASGGAHSVSAIQKIQAYFDVSVGLHMEHPDLARFYANIYYLAAYDQEVRKVLQTMRDQGVRRLIKLLDGVASGKQARGMAIALHDQLVGFIINSIALDGPWDLNALKRSLKRESLK